MVLERTGDCMFKTIPIGEVDYYIENENDMMVIDLRNAASYQSCLLYTWDIRC